METFEILCVTMHQKDFSKIQEMNIHSDVVFANQAEETSYQELDFDGHKAKMITTTTRGVGKNRNIALLYASGDILLFSDDDFCYYDGYDNTVMEAFCKFPKADIIIFNIDTRDSNGERVPTKIKKASVLHRWQKNPYGGPRIAIRRAAFEKNNIWFTLLFGGGALYPSGEDSKWISNALKAGMKIYLYPHSIGSVEYGQSTWYSGYNEEMYYGKGAYSKSEHSAIFRFLWFFYFSFRTAKKTKLKFSERMRWLRLGVKGYQANMSYQEYIRYVNQKTQQEKGG